MRPHLIPPLKNFDPIQQKLEPVVLNLDWIGLEIVNQISIATYSLAILQV